MMLIDILYLYLVVAIDATTTSNTVVIRRTPYSYSTQYLVRLTLTLMMYFVPLSY